MTTLSTLAPDHVDINDYFRPYASDADIRHALAHQHRYTSQRAVGIIDAYHRLFRDMDPVWDGPICLDVSPGFTLKEHAPLAGPCYKDFKYLQDWKLQNDEPTSSTIVFWVPRLLKDSKSKTVYEQKLLMAETRKRHSFPEYHLSGFGSAAMLAGLILAHFKRTGEKTPVNCYWVRSDTLRGDGLRIGLGPFNGRGLYCGHSSRDDHHLDGVGVFPLGMELGSLPSRE